MKKLMLCVSLCALPLGRPAIAGSIFDDTDPRQAPLVPPAPTEKPAPQTPPADSQTSSAPSEPAEPVPPPAPTPFAPTPETIEELGVKARSAVKDAKFLSQQYLDRAQADVEASLENDSDYVSARDKAHSAQQKLEDARKSGSDQDKLDASSACNVAAAELKSIRDLAFNASAPYKDAKALAAECGPPTTAPHDELKKSIAIAIANRNLVLGMTYEEACRSARAKGKLQSSDHNAAVYHWDVVSQIGSHRVITESHPSAYGPRNEYAIVPDYRVVGYVEATFIDTRLADFKRVLK